MNHRKSYFIEGEPSRPPRLVDSAKNLGAMVAAAVSSVPRTFDELRHPETRLITVPFLDRNK